MSCSSKVLDRLKSLVDGGIIRNSFRTFDCEALPTAPLDEEEDLAFHDCFRDGDFTKLAELTEFERPKK